MFNYKNTGIFKIFKLLKLFKKKQKIRSTKNIITARNFLINSRVRTIIFFLR
jgi:hypothetical protein